MTDRNRLICLLAKICPLPFKSIAVISDYLVDHGVTFATDNKVGGKWIPVTERLPENAEKVLALSKSNFGNGYLSWLVRYNPDAGAFFDYDSEWGNIKIHNITHWMPLPTPPKEVDHD